MATFGQIVYSVLDILKERTDDSYYTEEHIIFLASKMRALLIDRKYRNSRNQTYSPMSDENEQQICLDLVPSDNDALMCNGQWLESVQTIPSIVGDTQPKLSVVSDVIHSMVTYIPVERMPYVGYNKWLRNIIYAAKSDNGKVYLNSNNPQFMYLKKAKLSGVFSDPQEAVKLACDDDGNANKCNILEMKFPLEAALVPSCIEMVVQELTGSRYAPEDKNNDAKDGLGDAAVTNAKQQMPAEAVAKNS
jgi:hypothetical protein